MTADDIPAITVYQPHASLLMASVKLHETRPIECRHLVGRRIVIHAAKRPPLMGSIVERVVRDAGLDPKNLPRGAILGTALISDSVLTSERAADVAPLELMLGDWHGPGRWAWRMVEHIAFARPIPWRGQQGIWYVPREAIDDALHQNCRSHAGRPNISGCTGTLSELRTI